MSSLAIPIPIPILIHLIEFLREPLTFRLLPELRWLSITSRSFWKDLDPDLECSFSIHVVNMQSLL